MTNEIMEIFRSLTPESVIETVKTIKPTDVIMRLQNGHGISQHINMYRYLRFRVNRVNRISKIRYHNRVKKNRMKKLEKIKD